MSTRNGARQTGGSEQRGDQSSGAAALTATAALTAGATATAAPPPLLLPAASLQLPCSMAGTSAVPPILQNRKVQVCSTALSAPCAERVDGCCRVSLLPACFGPHTAPSLPASPALNQVALVVLLALWAHKKWRYSRFGAGPFPDSWQRPADQHRGCARCAGLCL